MYCTMNFLRMGAGSYVGNETRMPICMITNNNPHRIKTWSMKLRNDMGLLSFGPKMIVRTSCIFTCSNLSFHSQGCFASIVISTCKPKEVKVLWLSQWICESDDISDLCDSYWYPCLIFLWPACVLESSVWQLAWFRCTWKSPPNLSAGAVWCWKRDRNDSQRGLLVRIKLASCNWGCGIE